MKNLVLTLFLLLICIAAKSPAIQTYQYNYENVLGTSFELKVNTVNESSADVAEQLALKEIDRLNTILSTYNADSEVSRWMNTHGTEEKISPELFEVFALFDRWKEKTNGALSASAAVASSLWKKASIKNHIPDSEELSNAVEAMKQPHWILNDQHQTATHLSHQPLVLNSFVKSYIMRKVTEKIMRIGDVTGVVINIGGDIVVAGDQREKIFVADPLHNAENSSPLSVFEVSNRAVATSGNYRRGFRVGNQWFSHIVDVRTAMPVSEIISATVVANEATDAGALATAFNILSLEEIASLAASIPGVEYQLVTKAGNEITSDGWKKMMVESEKFISKENHVTRSVDQYELSIDLELARFEGRFRRPFVAVWVENKKKESVRSLAVWYNKPRWLPDLKRWFSKNQSITQDHSAMGSISSATRSSGKYSLVWDGLDDAGKEVPSGKYTVYIEAAREHGTYQIIKQEIDWKGKPQHFDLEGGVEITSASVDVHVKLAN